MREYLKNLLSSSFFLPRWYSIFLNPYFIARRALYVHTKKFAKVYSKDKVILDVGCGSKPYKELFSASQKYIGIDIEGGGHYDNAKNADAFFDGEHIPFPDDSFDVVLCTQVLEHSAQPDKLLSEMCRVLKKDGIVYITMPFVWNEHEVPYDFRRFTRYEHKRILEKNDFIIDRILTTTGAFGVCGQLLSAFLFESLAKRSLILKAIVAPCFCFPIQAFFMLCDVFLKNSWITLDYVVYAKKVYKP